MIADRYDAIVAGAGPAGSRTARELARAGLRVALLEEHREVGVPCHCSGLVSPRTLRLAQVGDDIVRNVLRGAVIHLADGARLRIGGGHAYAVAIDRSELDRRLARQAEDAGAQLLLQTRLLHFRVVGSPHHRSGEVVATVRREGRTAQLRAAILVGADGARSLVHHQLRGKPRGGLVAALGAVARYRANPHHDHVEIFVDSHSAPGWFGWTIPLEQGTARLGTGSANGVNPVESFRRLRRRFPDSFGQAELDSRSGGTIALWQPGPLVADRVLLVGDAARQVKPTSGGGIYAALRAAALVGETVRAALATSDCSRRGLGSYPRQWEAILGQEFGRQNDMRRVFVRLGDTDLRGLLEALRHPRLRDQIEQRGDIDFLSQVVWTVLRGDPRLALRLVLRLATAPPRFPGAWLAACLAFRAAER